VKIESNARPVVAGKVTKARSVASYCPANAARNGRRECAHAGCTTSLSRYNIGTHCVVHEHLESRGVRYPALRARGRVGARIEDVRDLIIAHDPGPQTKRDDYAHRLGINPRQLTGIVTLKGTNCRRPAPRLVMPDVLWRILHGLGLQHTRDQWECLA
jgi:hypothetical protein